MIKQTTITMSDKILPNFVNFLFFFAIDIILNVIQL